MTPTSDAQATTFIAALAQRAVRHVVAGPAGQMVWRSFGAGSPLVLLHGGHGSWLHWARNIDALARRFQVWVPDMPGYGESATPPEPSLASLVESTRASLAELVAPSEPLDVVGFSFGGLVATHLALARPSVRRLGLLGPGGHGGPRRSKGELQAWRHAAESGDDAMLAELMRHNLAVHMLSRPESVDPLALRIHTEACLHTRFRSKDISRAGGLIDALDAFSGEVLLIWGEDDVTAVPSVLSPLLVEQRAGRRAFVVPGSGHWVQYESADRVDALLLDWLVSPPAEHVGA